MEVASYGGCWHMEVASYGGRGRWMGVAAIRKASGIRILTGILLLARAVLQTGSGVA
ncbi:hypothetical protein BGX38DRAFT_1212609 [Terfezia claveryi]|nr:hypothetical protein BGX38DRAFT_1212609 [Terfezia claveryi]